MRQAKQAGRRGRMGGWVPGGWVSLPEAEVAEASTTRLLLLLSPSPAVSEGGRGGSASSALRLSLQHRPRVLVNFVPTENSSGYHTGTLSFILWSDKGFHRLHRLTRHRCSWKE